MRNRNGGLNSCLLKYHEWLVCTEGGRKEVSKDGEGMKKFRIRETKHLLTDADISNNTIVRWTNNTQKHNFFFKQKKSSKTQKNQKTSWDMQILAIYPSTRGLKSIGKRGFHHVLYGKISKKKICCAAILDHFQTKMFKCETTSFHYFSPRIPNL